MYGNLGNRCDIHSHRRKDEGYFLSIENSIRRQDVSNGFSIIAHWTRTLAGGHNNQAAALAVLLPGLIVMLLVIKSFSSSPGSSRDSGWGRRLLAVMLLLLVLPAGSAAVSSFLAPHIHHPALQRTVTFGIPLLALLTAGIPLMGRLLRTRYPVTLVSAAAGLFAGMVTVLVMNAVIASFDGGNSDFSLVKRRTRTIDTFMGAP